jgi:uncharacterized protein
MGVATPNPRGDNSVNKSLLIAAGLYAALLLAFWFAAIHFDMPRRIHGHMPSSFAAFALLLAPYWFFGFGLADVLRKSLGRPLVRVLLPGVLVIPYLIFSIARGEFRWEYAGVLFSIPVFTAGLFAFLPPSGERHSAAKFSWQDLVALSMFFLPVEFGLLGRTFPYSGLAAMPKLLLVDAALYSYLVVRKLEGVGYDFRPRVRDFGVGVRECALYAPVAMILGVALHFLKPHAGWPTAPRALGALLITFFFVAVPEELFFRGLLQNLLQGRLGRQLSLLIASVLFGLSHFNKPLPFNWRYVLLGSIAGVFYGRAWRDRHRVLASATTHTLVDVLWSLWFR